MISCESCRELLPEFSLGELDARDHKKVKFHLRQCRECAVELSEYRRVWSVLPLALDPVDPPETVKVHLMDRVKSTPRVDRSTRRDTATTSSRPTRVRSKREQRWRRYLVAALVLVALFSARSYFAAEAQNEEHLFASNPSINARVRALAASTGHLSQPKDKSGFQNFVYVPLTEGAAYDSLDAKADGYAILNRFTDKWHFFANSLNENGADNLKLWLQSGDGTVVASSTLVIREFGNTRCSIASSGDQAFARALITRESDPAAKRPSQEIVFEAILLRPVPQPVEVAY